MVLTKMMDTKTLLVLLIIAVAPVGHIIINNDSGTIKMRMPNGTYTCALELIECSNTWNNTNVTPTMPFK
jgi:hypothetical protein